MTEKDLENIIDENPPIMRTWKRLYTLVLCIHFAIVLFFIYFTYYYK